MSEIETENMGPRYEFEVKKLIGSENYHTWQYAMMNYIQVNNLKDCLIAKEGEFNTPKDQRTLSICT